MIKFLSHLNCHRKENCGLFLLLLFLLGSCKSDDNISHTGFMRLASLEADTTSLHIGTATNKKTKVSVYDELAPFMETYDYNVIITDSQNDTVQNYPFFSQMPDEIELAEGSYTLIASKGDNYPAAFESPYFRGKSNFSVHDGMYTSVKANCTMNNARLTIKSSEAFNKVYTDYIIEFTSPFIKKGNSGFNGFPVKKEDMEHPLYMQVADEGTDVGIVVYVKKSGEEDFKSFYVEAPLHLKSRYNVQIQINLIEGNSSGIGIEVLLDDSLTKLSVETDIPDYMWGQMGKPVLKPVGFTENEALENHGVFDKDISVDYSMSAGVSSLIVESWSEDDPEVKQILDLAKSSDLEKAIASHLLWKVDGKDNNILLDEKTKSGKIFLTDFINSLPSPAEGTKVYQIRVYGKDAAGKQFESNVVSFSVKVFTADAPYIDSSLSSVTVVEGDEMLQENQVKYVATGGIDTENIYLNISDGSSEEKYLLSNSSQLEELKNKGIEITSANNREVVVDFKKNFTVLLNAPETGSTTYTYTFGLKDKKGKTAETRSFGITVDAPVFSLDITDGNAFAKRVYLTGKLEKGSPEKMSFYQNDEVVPLQVNNLELLADGVTYRAEVLNLEPNTGYSFKAVYNKIRETKKSSVRTEEVLALPNAKFDSWIETKINDLTNGANIFIGKVNLVGACPDGWACVNAKTFVKEANVSSTYNTVPSSLKCPGKNGDGVRIRTVGWDNGAGNSAISLYHVAAGKLFLGSYSYNHGSNQDTYNYGIPFASRPNKVKFDYKYTPFKNDSFKVWAVAIHKEGNTEIEIGRGELVKGGAVNSWTSEEININYSVLNKKATHFYVVFSSSSRCSDNESVETNNLKPYVENGEVDGYTHYEGSNFYIDNVELIYE